ncbi:MAG: hypothetical protein H6825_15575 [Planctomycetes bacterium]|nr:hypothetical protein [Planctomycetota bacterium]
MVITTTHPLWIALAQAGADVVPEATWGGAGAWLHRLGLAGPWILGAGLLIVLLAALRQSRRYRALAVLGDDARRVVQDVIAEVEARTSGEVVPVVVERSDPHPAAAWRGALAMLLIGSVLLAHVLPWERPELLLPLQMALGLLGWALVRALPSVQRLFIVETRASAVAEEQAFQEFFGQGLHETSGRTGVLLFVSLLERRAIVLADKGIAEKVDGDVWADARTLVLEGAARGALQEGLVAALRRCGDVLAEHAPRRDDDVDEIANRLVVRRE